MSVDFYQAFYSTNKAAGFIILFIATLVIEFVCVKILSKNFIVDDDIAAVNDYSSS